MEDINLVVHGCSGATPLFLDGSSSRSGMLVPSVKLFATPQLAVLDILKNNNAVQVLDIATEAIVTTSGSLNLTGRNILMISIKAKTASPGGLNLLGRNELKIASQGIVTTPSGLNLSRRNIVTLLSHGVDQPCCQLATGKGLNFNH